MFTTNDNKGFCMDFANGYAISVQWGGENYCSNKVKEEPLIASDMWQCPNAEVCIWDASGNILSNKLRENGVDIADWADGVIGWQTPDQVLAIMNIVAKMS